MTAPLPRPAPGTRPAPTTRRGVLACRLAWALAIASTLTLAGGAPAAGQLPGLDAGGPAGAPAEPAPLDLKAERASAVEELAAAEERIAADAAFATEARLRLLEEAESELEAARQAPPVDGRAEAAGLPPEELRARIAGLEADAAALRAEVVSSRAEADRLNRRLEGLPAETQAAREAVAAAERLLAEAEDGPVRDLREAQLQAAQAELEQRVGLASSLPLRERLARLETETLEARARRLQERLDVLTARDAALRQAEAEARARAARQTAADAENLPPAARRIAERLVEVANRQENIEAEAAAYAGKAGKVAEDATLYRDQLASAQERVAFGMTEAVGVQFQARRDDLPDLGAARKRVRVLQDRRAGYATTLLDLADDQRSLDAQLAAARAALPAGGGAAAELDALGAAYGRLLDAAIAATRRAQNDVVNLLAAEQDRLDALTAYADFLNERLLWTPDLGRLGVGDFPRASSAAWQWWTRLDPAAAVDQARRALVPPPLVETILLLLGLVLLGVRSRLRKLLSELGEPVGTLARDRFGFTLRAFGATVLVALPFPLMLFAVGQALASAAPGSVVGQLGRGLLGAAVVLGPVLLLRAITRQDGLAPVHFLWPAAGCRALRSAVLKLGLLLAAFRFCSNFLSPEGGAGVGGPLDATTAGVEVVDLRLISRLFLLVTLAGVSLFMARMFRRNGALGAALWQEPGKPLARFHRLWYPLLVGTPLAVATLAALGYHNTALVLEDKLLWTVWVITGLVIAYALALRWLRLTHRQLMYAELLKKREQQKQAAAAAREAAEEKLAAARAARRSGRIEGDDEDDETDEGEDDAREQLAAIAEQAAEGDAQITPFSLNEKTGKLIKLACGLALLAGLWAVWSGILPALEFLNTVKLPLLTQTETVEGVDVTTPVTLGQLFLCVVLLVLTFTGGRQLPGLLDLLVLTRFSVQAGTRYAATMLTQYVIVAVGLLLALSSIGLGWGRLQWLVAALSVGLGFGLQEIFANFVSGLIILFERPIRVGDTVSIGETTGVVTRIRIRATTITDLDLRELIVPNREFITGQLINWSLSNPVIRLIIPVGIAYGADTRLAQKLLIQIARKHRDVLNEPAASALFMGFGNNTLNFELRIFVKEVLRRFQILSELNLAIDDAFADAGITIAFPQRDVHLDTLKPLEVVMRREQAKAP